MDLLTTMYLKTSYVVHMLCEFFLCAYVFIIPKKYDIFYALYILLLVVLKLIFKYECIINYFDKKILDPSYELGSDPSYVPYKRELYNDNLHFIFLINCFILLNLVAIAYRNRKSQYIPLLCGINIVFWIFLEYKTQDYSPLFM